MDLDTLGVYFNIPDSKKREIWSTHQAQDQRRESLALVYVQNHPCPNWKDVATAIQEGVHFIHSYAAIANYVGES